MRDRVRKALSISDGDWLTCRLVVRSELAALLLASIALTIAPGETLGALAGVTAWASDLVPAYRPAVAFVGLLLVGLFTWASLAMWRARSPGEPPQATGQEDKRDGLRAAA